MKRPGEHADSRSGIDTGSPAAFDHAPLRRAVALVALLNVIYFGIEFAVARSTRSVSLFADSIDFLEDATVNLLILLSLGWKSAGRARMGQLLAAILLVPGIATLWTAWGKVVAPEAPSPVALGLTGTGALVINLFCALQLVRFRNESGSLTKAAFLSARNDAVANFGIIAAAFATRATSSAWPDLLVGLGIFAMNLDAAGEVFSAARREHDRADASPGDRSSAA